MLAAIASLNNLQAGLTSAATAASGSTLFPAGGSGPAAPFSDLIADAVGQINQLEGQASVAVSGLMTGNGVDVHQALIATERADMAFEMALAVRNKAVQAYQSVMGMQF
jgi:flagellar hook-basal body complex protein FliE